MVHNVISSHGIGARFGIGALFVFATREKLESAFRREQNNLTTKIRENKYFAFTVHTPSEILMERSPVFDVWSIKYTIECDGK